MMDSLYFNILFIDIETAAQYPNYDALPERLKPLWDRKSGYLKNENSISSGEMYPNKAAIYAEFGKIITIGIGGLYLDKKKGVCLKVKTLAHENEATLLKEFASILDNHKAGYSLQLCAHNGKEFDFPYLSRRMLINGIRLPEALNLGGKKPWEVNHLDTMDMWKFGDYKNFTSLDLLAAIFDIESSKSDISGADVNRVYYEENDLNKIRNYCAKDVVVLVQLFLKMKSQKPIEKERIFLIENN